MQPLHQSIQLQEAIALDKKRFINEEIYPQINQSFTCCVCQNKVNMQIQPFKTGSPLDTLYKGNKVLDTGTLIQHKIITKANHHSKHWGEFLHNDLPTLYFLAHCTNCKAGTYIGFFSYGEKQPGLDILSIAGVWKYTIV